MRSATKSHAVKKVRISIGVHSCCQFSMCTGVAVDFQEGLAAFLGKDAPNLSPAVISRLTPEWQASALDIPCA
jgi:hypothetical protein